MNKQERIRMLERNKDEGRIKYRSGLIQHDQYIRMRKDANRRIRELRKSTKS